LRAADRMLAAARALRARAKHQLVAAGNRARPILGSARSLSPRRIHEWTKSQYERLIKYWWAALLIGLAGLAIGAIGAWQPTTSALCSIGGIRGYVCRPIGLGGVATPAQEEGYARAVRNGCLGIREYLRAESPDNPLFPQAQQRWNTRFRHVMRDDPLARTEPVVATSGSRPSRAAATAQLAEVGHAQAAELCGRYGRIAGYSLQSFEVALGEPECDSLGAGWTCSAEGRAQCAIRWRREIVIEQC
jgi:hypothetical protein